MNNNHNPWADASNQAVGALYKHYLTRPNPGQIEQQQLQNQRLKSALETDQLQRQNIESQIGARQFDLDQARQQSQFADMFAESFGQLPQVSESVVPQGGDVGPVMPVTQGDRNSAIAGLFEQFAPRLDEDTVAAARDSLGTAGALRFENPVDRQLALDEKATNYGAYSEGFERELNNPQPYTLSPGARRFDADNQQVAYAPPRQGGGSSVQLPDGTIIDIDGGVVGQTEIGRSANNDVQKQQIEGAKFNRMVDYTRQLSTDPTNFGVMGYTKGKLQDTAMLLNGVTQVLGYDAPEQAFSDIIRKEAGNPELSENFLTELYDPQLNALQKSANLMVYQAASALASQSGRSVSDRDVRFFKEIVGDPQSFFMNQQKFMSGLNVMQDILANQQGVLQDASGGDVVGEQYTTPDPGQFSNDALQNNIVTITGDEDYQALAPGTQFIAPDGTTRIKQ